MAVNYTYSLLDEVKEILVKIKSAQKKKIFGNCYEQNDYIFTKEDGSTYYPTYPSHELWKCLRRNGLSHIRWHDLRHTTASLLIIIVVETAECRFKRNIFRNFQAHSLKDTHDCNNVGL
ncbi:MAG: hypothetical protein IJN96_06590 [Clostridia bacterium]|nr:hypothetical protein [Clostridia bacterium]